jgi:hypothetical protein
MKRLMVSLIPVLCFSGCALFQLDTPPGSPEPDAKAASPTTLAPPPPAATPLAPTTVSELKKKVLLLPFLDRSEEADEALPKSIQTQLLISLAAMPDVIPLTLADYPDAALVPELGAYPIDKVLALARAEGIAGVVLGSIDEIDDKDASLTNGNPDTGLFHTDQFQTEVRIHLAVYDVASRKQLYAKPLTGKVTEERAQILESAAADVQRRDRAQQAAVRAIREATAAISGPLQRIAWSGRIAKIDLRRYYITGGRATGLLPGQLLRVLAEGQSIYDAQTGKLLGTAPGRMKGLLKIVDNFGPDASIAVLHSGAGFREQDRVEPYFPPQEP